MDNKIKQLIKNMYHKKGYCVRELMIMYKMKNFEILNIVFSRNWTK